MIFHEVVLKALVKLKLEECIDAKIYMDFQYNCLSSYPDWLLTILLPCAINYIILNTPVNIL